MNVLEKFSNDFKEFVKVTYNTYWELPVIHRKKFSKALEEIIINSLKNEERIFDLNIEDLKQEIRFFWLKYEKQYNEEEVKERISLRSYIVRRTIWDIRDWIKKHNKIIKIDYDEVNVNDEYTEFKLNIRFLLKGTNFKLLKNLSPYERYIIFLVFKEEKNMLEMSKILQKDRRIIKIHYHKILEKIRENYKNVKKRSR